MELTDNIIKRINRTFKDADISIIKDIIYFDWWTSYEEHGGVLIFKDNDDKIKAVNFGSNVFSYDNTCTFTPYEIDERECQYLIKHIEEEKLSQDGY